MASCVSVGAGCAQLAWIRCRGDRHRARAVDHPPGNRSYFTVPITKAPIAQPLAPIQLFEHALRSPVQLRGMWVVGSIFVLFGSLSGLHAHASGIRLVGWMMAAWGIGMVVLFSVRTSVWITPSAVRVRNPMRTLDLRWDQIRAFRLGRYKVLPAALIIDLVDGSRRYAWAIQLSNVSMGNPNAWEHRLVKQLNELLEDRRRDAQAAQAGS